MSEDRMDDKERRALQREAAAKGASAAYSALRGGDKSWPGTSRIASRLYPEPEARRQRTDSRGVTWRLMENFADYEENEKAFEYRLASFPDGPWVSLGGVVHDITKERVAIWADLLAKPHEDGDADFDEIFDA